MKVICCLFCITFSLMGNYIGSWPLDSVMTRIDSAISIQWVADSAVTDPTWYQENGDLCTGEDSIYRHSDFITGQSYRSIAYSYGGEDDWITFRERILEGTPAGSHLCHYKSIGDPTPYVTGSDCSGFLSYVWKVPRLSTTGFINSSRYEKISFEKLLPGDALVKAGTHAVIVIDPKTPENTLIAESTFRVNGCRYRSIDVTSSYWETYTALRYPEVNTKIKSIHPMANGVTIGRRNGKLTIYSSIETPITVSLYMVNGRRMAVYTLSKREKSFVIPNAYKGILFIKFDSPLLKGIVKKILW